VRYVCRLFVIWSARQFEPLFQWRWMAQNQKAIGRLRHFRSCEVFVDRRSCSIVALDGAGARQRWGGSAEPAEWRGLR
jgi:hypothetical protein